MSATKYIILCLAVVFVIYEFLTVLQSQDYPTATNTQNMTAMTNYSFNPVGKGVRSVQSLYNASMTCGAGNYTYNTTHVRLLASQLCQQYLIYSVDYTYERSKTVMGIDLSFIVAILVVIFIGLMAYQLMKAKK